MGRRLDKNQGLSAFLQGIQKAAENGASQGQKPVLKVIKYTICALKHTKCFCRINTRFKHIHN